MAPSVRSIYIEESILGIFGISEDDEIVEKALYPPDPRQIAAALSRQQRGELTKEIIETIDKLMQRGFKRFIFSNRTLADAVKARWSVEVEVKVETLVGDYLRSNMEKLAIDYGTVKETSQLFGLNHEVSMIMAGQAVGKALSGREALIIQAVQLLNELDKALNAFSSKLREWYGLHFPELSRLVEDHEAYAVIVNTFEDRTFMEPSALSKLGYQTAEAEEIHNAAQASIGTALSPEDIAPIKQLAAHLINLHSYRRDIEEYASALATEITPNLSEVAGPILAARLVEKAGGLRRLSMMPSSTIQLLGAEKAMFRALKSKSKPPKHGLIFQHPIVHRAPRRLRGRAARSLAAKLAIAARADAFTGSPIGIRLKSELDAEMAELLAKGKRNRK